MRPPGAPLAVALAVVLAGAIAGRSSGPAPANHRVDIRDLAFHPETVAARPGDTVTWTNQDIVPHTVTGPSDSWDSGDLSAGATFSLVVAEGDTVRYLCRYHPTMTGRLVVAPQPSPQSLRRASLGSRRLARRAGSQHARRV